MPAARADGIRRDHVAIYDAFYNSNRIARVTVELSHEGDQWTLHGFIHDTRGLADTLNVSGHQTTIGRWQNDRYVPDEYRMSFSVLGFKKRWRADFDWAEERIVTTRKRNGEVLPLPDNAIDPLALSLHIRSGLRRDQQRITAHVLDKNDIEEQTFEARNPEWLDTALGCLEVTPVHRMHNSDRRTSVGWYANDYLFAPVRLEHIRKGRNAFRLEIASLIIDGREVEPAKQCADESVAPLPAAASSKGD